MSEEMDILGQEQNNVKNIDCEMEQGEESSGERKPENGLESHQGVDVPDSKPNVFFPDKTTLKVEIPDFSLKTPSKELPSARKSTESEIGVTSRKLSEEKLSPPVFVGEPYQRQLTPPTSLFQKPSVCRTHSLGSGDHSPFAMRRRQPKTHVSNQLQSASAFRRRKLCMQSPIRSDLFESDDVSLKRCNSAPMLNDIMDMETQTSWHPTSVTPGQVRARRFSATVLSVHASPSSGAAKSTSRLHQLKKEESIENIQHKETAHEREVQTSIQMFNTCEELSLTDSVEGLNGIVSAAGDANLTKTLVTSTDNPHSPLHSSAPVNIPSTNKQCPNRAIDFSLPGNGGLVTGPLHPHHPGGGGIPSPLTISPSTCLLSLSPLPPSSPTRGLPISATGKQCFSPSMHCLRPGSLSPSPSPTRRTFVTRRRSQSPCIVKPSALGSIKRKYDSDSEGGGCSPKRMFVPGPNNIGPLGSNHDILAPGVITPFFSRTIHRSYSLSSSSIDSDINVSPSPPQSGGNTGFLPTSNPLVGNHLRERNSHSPFQLPPHNPFLSAINPHGDLGRCSSPASSTCSSSSLEGLKDLQPFSQNHLNNIHLNSTNHSLLMKSSVKDQQSSMVSAVKPTNITS